MPCSSWPATNGFVNPIDWITTKTPKGEVPGLNPQPAATTGSAMNVTTTSATLNGTVNPNGFLTTAYFRWGTSTSYGKTTPSQSMGSGTSPVSISANLTGLAPNTTYHFRIVATNSNGTSYGSNGVFTTSSAPSPSKPNLIVGPPPSLSCSGPPGLACSGSLSIKSDGGQLTWTAFISTDSGGFWLSLSPMNGTTPSSPWYELKVLNGLQPGTYKGRITFTASGAANSPVVLPATLTVIASQQPPSKFSSGDNVRTTAQLHVRTGPGLGYSMIRTMNSNTAGIVLGGPQTADGYTWWKIRYDEDTEGWSSDHRLESFTRPSPRFDVGKQIRTTASLNVRTRPCIDNSYCAIIKSVPSGTIGTIVSFPTPRPRVVDGYYWWRVRYSDGTEGWSAENWLTSASVVLLLVPTATGNTFQIIGVPKDIREVQLSVFDREGRRVFYAELTTNSFVWRGLDTEGRRLANGIYLYVVTVRTPDGRILKSDVRKLILLR